MPKRVSEEEIRSKKYGKLTAVKAVGKNKSGKFLWLCKCDCGNECIVVQQQLRSGDTKSCGCYQKERMSTRKPYSHRERLYALWIGIRQRCNNPKNISYPNYGAKGINVCEEWENNYIAFRDWALKTGYDETLPRGEQTIERINVFLGYSPENCTWKTISQQQRNKRNSKLYEYNGESHTLIDWSEITGVEYSLLRSRVLGYGIPIKEAIETPKKETEKYNYNGKSLTMSEWAKELGVTPHALRARLKKGKPYSEIFTSKKWNSKNEAGN